MRSISSTSNTIRQQPPHGDYTTFDDPRMMALSCENTTLVSEIQALRSLHNEQLAEKDAVMEELAREKSNVEWNMARLKEENKRLLEREDTFVKEVDRLEQHVQTLEGENFSLRHSKRQKTGENDSDAFSSSYRNNFRNKDKVAAIRMRFNKLRGDLQNLPLTTTYETTHATNNRAATPEDCGKIDSDERSASDMLLLPNIVSPGNDDSSSSASSSSSNNNNNKKKTATIDLSVALRARIKFLEDSLATMNTNLSKVTENLVTATSENARRVEDLALANSKVQAFKAAALQAKTEKDRLQTELKKAIAENTASSNEKLVASEDDDPSAKCTAADASTLKSQLEALQRVNQALGKQASKAIASLRAEVTKMKSENVHLCAKLATAEFLGGQQPQPMPSRPSELIHIQSENARLRENLITSESAAISVHNELLKAQTECVQVRDDLIKANRFGMKAAESITSLRKELADSKKENADLCKVLTNAQESCSSLKTLLVYNEETDRAILETAQQAATRNTELEAEIARLDTKVAEGETSLETERAQVATLTSDLASLHQQNADGEKSLEGARAEVTKLTSELSSLRQQNADYAKSLEAERAQAAKLTSALDNLHQQNADYATTLSEWTAAQQASISELHSKIYSLEADLASKENWYTYNMQCLTSAKDAEISLLHQQLAHSSVGQGEATTHTPTMNDMGGACTVDSSPTAVTASAHESSVDASRLLKNTFLLAQSVYAAGSQFGAEAQDHAKRCASGFRETLGKLHAYGIVEPKDDGILKLYFSEQQMDSWVSIISTLREQGRYTGSLGADARFFAEPQRLNGNVIAAIQRFASA